MPIIRVVEPGLGVVHVQYGIIVVCRVFLHQIQLSLAAFEHRIVADLAPLAVAGPSNHPAVHRAGEVIGSAQIVAVIVGVQLTLVIQHRGGTVLNTLHHHTQTGLVAVDIAVV